MYVKHLLLCLLVLPLYAEQKIEKLPIYFHPKYDIGFWGIEKLHPFDSKKYGKVKRYLQTHLHLTDNQFHTPERISDDELKKVMTESYINSLFSSYTIAWIVELPIVAFLPNILVQHYLLDSMRYATDGTIKATQLALSPKNKYHYAINLSGGYHHATDNYGEGFCVYPDIPLACKKVWETNPKCKILYVDLDAHQGNGVEITLEYEIDQGIFAVFDIYGANNYPCDIVSKRIRNKIQYNFPLTIDLEHIHSPTDNEYLGILKSNLPKAIEEQKPDLIFYNAGTDIYKKDTEGGMNISKEGIKERDAFVFAQAKEHKIPIVMTLSGGYSPESAQIIGESIQNIVTYMHAEK
ncbi:MAG TPA: histone deacetylase [Candidatus Babeliales bacterium]|jgi:histone deacetylase 11|nr:histone deacetylase [Candidatus Babeliales bacterium]